MAVSCLVCFCFFSRVWSSCSQCSPYPGALTCPLSDPCHLRAWTLTSPVRIVVISLRTGFASSATRFAKRFCFVFPEHYILFFVFMALLAACVCVCVRACVCQCVSVSLCICSSVVFICDLFHFTQILWAL